MTAYLLQAGPQDALDRRCAGRHQPIRHQPTIPAVEKQYYCCYHCNSPPPKKSGRPPSMQIALIGTIGSVVQQPCYCMQDVYCLCYKFTAYLMAISSTSKMRSALAASSNSMQTSKGKANGGHASAIQSDK